MPSELLSDGVAEEGTKDSSGIALFLIPKRSFIDTPSAFANRHTSAIVGFARLRSTCDSIDLETPDLRDNSSKDKLRAFRKDCSV